RRLLFGVLLLHDGHPDRYVHARLRGEPYRRLGGACTRTVRGQPADSAPRRVPGREGRGLRADRPPGQGRQLRIPRISVIFMALVEAIPDRGGRSLSSYY